MLQRDDSGLRDGGRLDDNLRTAVRGQIMRIAIIRDGIVENVIVASESYPAPAGCLAIATDEAGPGWVYKAGLFSPPDETAPPPQDRFAMAAARMTMEKL